MTKQTRDNKGRFTIPAANFDEEINAEIERRVQARLKGARPEAKKHSDCACSPRRAFVADAARRALARVKAAAKVDDWAARATAIGCEIINDIENPALFFIIWTGRNGKKYCSGRVGFPAIAELIAALENAPGFMNAVLEITGAVRVFDGEIVDAPDDITPAGSRKPVWGNPFAMLSDMVKAAKGLSDAEKTPGR